MDGVIYHGNQILPGVPEFIQWLHDEKKEYSKNLHEDLKIKIICHWALIILVKKRKFYGKNTVQ